MYIIGLFMQEYKYFNRIFNIINKHTINTQSYYYDAKKDGIFLNDDKIFLSVECRIQTKKDTINKIVRSSLHIYNMAIYCMLMRNKIFNKIL